MIAPVLEASLTVLFGSIAGGITNTVAIWMLFHPYEPPRVRGRPLRFLQGAIPKNRDRLAAAMGRTVGERLLTGEDLARALAEPGFRSAFDERLEEFLQSILEQERGSLLELLPPPVMAEVRPLLDDAVDAALHRLETYLASERFRETARGWAVRLMEEVRDRPVGELLTDERESALTNTAHALIRDTVGGAGFERAIRDYLERASVRLLRPDRTLEEVLPVGLVASVEKAIAGYLPLAIERLATLMEDPDARDKLRDLLHGLMERFLQDLNFYKRVVASLIIPPDTVDRVIRSIETEGATRLSELLHDPTVRDAMARSVNDAIVDFLRRPVSSVLGEPGDESVEQAKDTVAGWALGLARDPQTGEFLVDRLRTTLGAAEQRTWGELLGKLPPEKVADALVSAARSGEAAALYREAAERALRLLLERPVGRPADVVGEDAAERLTVALRGPLWQWIQDQVPMVLRRVDISAKVEQKILEFPMEKVEELVRSVTQRELHLIVYLGYALGAVIGGALVAVQALT